MGNDGLAAFAQQVYEATLVGDQAVDAFGLDIEEVCDGALFGEGRVRDWDICDILNRSASYVEPVLTDLSQSTECCKTYHWTSENRRFAPNRHEAAAYSVLLICYVERTIRAP